MDGAGAMRNSLIEQYPFLAVETADRFVRSYGTLTRKMLGNARTAADLGGVVGADLTEREVGWLVHTEWVRTADDVLWRRSKLGLRFGAEERAALDDLLKRTTPEVT